MLSLFSISILSIILITSINNIDYAHGQFNQTEKIQFNPGTLQPQAPVNVETGQDLLLPGTVIGVRDPDTNQIIAKEVRFFPPKVTGPSIVGTLDGNGLFSSADLPESGFGGEGVPPITPDGRLSDESSGSGFGLFSTSNPALTAPGTAALPTFNPPLKRCETVQSGTEGGFDIAKYAFTGNMNKDKLEGNEFAFQIFADLVDGDDYTIEGEDAPYKATMLTDNGNKKVNVHMKEIATLCIDTQHAINIQQITEVDLDKSDLFKELEY